MEKTVNNNMIEPIGLPEAVFEGDYLVATYFYSSDAGEDVYEKAKSFAIGQTLGTWLPVPGITNAMRKKYGGKLVSIYDIPPIELKTDLPEKSSHIIQIAFPDDNFIPQFPMLITTLLGNDVSTSAQVKLIDLKFSKKFLNNFSGPRFGIDGIYKYFNISRRPIILNMIKPCLGYSPKEGAKIFRKIALGGVDIIKDDELFANTSYSKILDRVRLYTKTAKQVYEETGHLTKYCVNITDRQDKMIDYARDAIDAGAGALLVNFIATGLGALQALAEDKYINIPIIAHYASVGSMTESPNTGIASYLILGKFARIAGADLCMFSSPYSTYPFMKRRYKQIANLQRLPLYEMHQTMPVVGGGIHPNAAKKITDDLGKEIMLAVGGAILGHPLGITEGAKAMMKAVEVIGNGGDLMNSAKCHKGLKIALDKWK
jgi:2,3-diketo-5-methylthiopentyl-1-phosphate enolase